jgi:hypothetical protein
MSSTNIDREPSGAAVGWTAFAAVMMILVGGFQAMSGLIAILRDDFYVVTREYLFQFNTTAWGWIHLIIGVVVVVSGFFLFTGNVLARTVGVIVALLCAFAGFLWVPYYPVWGITFVVISVVVIWALTAHGRDIVEYDRY